MNGGDSPATRCPRCDGAFHCSATIAQVHDARPCACTSLHLDTALLAGLRERYAGCLCIACLAQLQAAEPIRE